MEQTALMPDVAPAAPSKGKTTETGAVEFTVNKDELLRELAGLQRIVPRKTTVPILFNIHLQATGHNLVLSASDLDLGLRTVCPARVKKEGRLTIPAHKLFDYARLLEDGDITMRLLENGWVQIKSGRSHTKMVGLAPESFPSLPLFPAASAVKLDVQALRYLIERTLFAVCTEESRYILNGALLLVKPEGVTMVSTDGHRMAHAQYTKAQAATNEMRILLPKKALAELNSLLNATKAEQIQFAQNDTTLFFAVGSRLLTSRQIMGRFPNYEAVLPQAHPNNAVVLRQELLLALQRVAQFSDEKSNCIRVRLSKNEFKLSSSNVDTGESEDALKTSYTGEPKTIAFNSQYLIDFLKAVDSENIRLEFKDADSASELRPEETTNKEYAYRYIVMPLKA
ncbi:MAG: polymerase beta subunit [Candidatus Sulfotelmatobacter sp.]|nr:polymerase beta subunit [Candidatus Sulfotelmatobacter sp.]